MNHRGGRVSRHGDWLRVGGVGCIGGRVSRHGDWLRVGGVGCVGGE